MPVTTTTRPTARIAPLWVSVVLGVAALALIVVAVLYLVEPAHSLPGFLPGHTAHGTRPRTKHGLAAAVVALLAIVGVWYTGRRKSAGDASE